MKLVVGLGNPGRKYDETRHNVGFDVLDELASRWGHQFSAEKFHGWFVQAEFAGQRVALLKPTTFMNRSGQAVGAAGRFYKLDVTDLIVVADDLALPLGKLRLRAKGSAGSHNGLQSVIDYVGSAEWSRLRIGIGSPIGVPSVYVLSRFDPEDVDVIRSARKRAADAVECWIENGIDLAMTRYNTEPNQES